MEAAAVLLALVYLAAVSSALCPSGYQPAGTKCFKAFTTATSWCDAQTACAGAGGRLVEGAEWMAILSDGNSEPWKLGLTYIWTGLTDLLEERKRSKDGWHWASGGRASAADVKWEQVEPNNAGDQDCAGFRSWSGYVVDDGHCSGNSAFICEPVTNPKRLTQFEPATTQPLTPNGFASGECKTELQGLEMLDCFAACLHANSTGCKALYFNAAAKSCILLHHSDASVRLADPAAWIKYRGVA